MLEQKVISFHDIVNDDSEPPPPIIDDGVLLDRSLLLIVGQPKANKSFLALNMGVAIASGTDFAGFTVVDKHRVLFLSAEGGYYSNRERIKTITADIDEADLHEIFFSTKVVPDLGNDADDTIFKECIEKYKPKVLILDPFIRFHTADENSSSSMSNIFAKISKLIEEHDIAVILVHHEGKKPSNNSKGGRGSSVIHAEYDSCIKIRKQKNANHKIEFDMRHVETPEHKELVFNTDTFWFEDPYKSSPIVEYISQNGLSYKKDMVSYLKTTLPCSSAKAYRIIDTAVSEEIIVQDGKKYKLSS